MSCTYQITPLASWWWTPGTSSHSASWCNPSFCFREWFPLLSCGPEARSDSLSAGSQCWGSSPLCTHPAAPRRSKFNSLIRSCFWGLFWQWFWWSTSGSCSNSSLWTLAPATVFISSGWLWAGMRTRSCRASRWRYERTGIWSCLGFLNNSRSTRRPMHGHSNGINRAYHLHSGKLC